MTTVPKPKVIVTGGRGLIGSKFMAAYQDKYDLVLFDRSGEPSIDITNQSLLEEQVARQRDAAAIVHFAAYTDVTGAFAQTDDKNGVAWQVNVVGTANLAQLAAKYQIPLIHLSTAYVFDGNKPSLYFEDDEPNPIEWYGQTKAEAEKMITQSGAKATILRIDQPFSRETFAKVDTLHRLINGLETNSLLPQFTNHYFGPTYIEDLVKVIDFFIRCPQPGIFHASSGEKWSDYDFAWAIKDILDLPGKIKKGDLDNYLQTINRPYQRNTAMNNDKLTAVLDFKLKTIKAAMKETQR